MWIIKDVNGEIIGEAKTETGAEKKAQRFADERAEEYGLARDKWDNHGFRVKETNKRHVSK